MSCFRIVNLKRKLIVCVVILVILTCFILRWLPSMLGRRDSIFVCHTDTCQTVSHSHPEKLSEAFFKDVILESVRMPTNRHYWPGVGNGHIAMVVHNKSVFMNGLYNGRHPKSHRAAIPSMCSFQLIPKDLDHFQTQYKLNIAQGFFKESILSQNSVVEQTIYAHRMLPSLLVVEVNLRRYTTSFSLAVKLEPEFYSERLQSSDLNIDSSDSEIKGVGYFFGTIKESEYNDSAVSMVHVYYTKLPDQLELPDGVLDGVWLFMMSIGSHKTEAHEAYKKGVKLFLDENLLNTHISGWSELWSNGRIDIIGNKHLAEVTNASLYYILSSLPLKDNVDNPFIGLSPGGLDHGEVDSDYLGHVFWDQETWMYPSILMLFQNIAKLIVMSRIRTLDAAKKYAQTRGYRGAMYPWESAFTGLDVTPCDNCSQYQQHITGDIAFAMQQFLYMTNDIHFLKNERGIEAINAIADFWVSRVNFNTESKKYEIKGVMPPDEYHFPVNNSVYTNYIAKVSLLLPGYAAVLLNQERPKHYEEIAENIYIPFDTKENYHPEFDGYKKGTIIKQADVVLLSFPLMMKMQKEVQRNNLQIYEKVIPGGPAMSWGMFAIGWLELGELKKAEEALKQNLRNVQGPFKVWSEDADGGGAVNFITGMGGYLQLLLFGYAGFRIHPDHLEFNPILPPDTQAFRIVGLDYRGHSMEFFFGPKEMTIQVTGSVLGAEPLVLMLSGSGMRYSLQKFQPYRFSPQKAAISIAST